ncbi:MULTISPECIES: hypothetical protein [Lelliottia]|uniref:Chromosome partition protein Smc n=1 Tax=Lelliottia aquatilis TaxID=2080838 RepID=A0ABX4ZWD2_9ENTR|nr:MULTISPECIES: hypothetical protein [Lelliottia]POZ13791.1 hypothetical protein C3Z09_21390 [Lelliottia aquatilis]POZ15209.1 hypothetical protein C3708_22485 [Lelliottia sp. 7254-16]POZ18948.1 hypothetical protein C3712_22330 [Lelliottia aquatilis]POZ20516.1 hypothetical protein C3711_22535 [Lelliottia aquatilis]POZ30559.1 hypothetical protein C3710_22130 [Lelliottia aquatilis]
MTDGWLTLRRVTGVVTTGLMAALLGLSLPGQAATPEGRSFLDGLQNVKLPDSPVAEGHATPAPPKNRHVTGGQRGGINTRPAARKTGAPVAAAANATPNTTRSVVPAPSPDNADVQHLTAALAEARAALAQSQARVVAAGEVQATVDGLNRRLAGLQEKLTQTEIERDDARRDATAQVAQAKQATAESLQARDEAQAGLSATEGNVARLTKELSDRGASLAALESQVAELAGVKQELVKQKQAVTDLTASTEALTSERDALKADTATLAAAAVVTPAPVVPSPVARHAPETAAEKEAYVSGWQIAGMVRRARVVQTALGLAADQTSFMAGLQDGVAGTPVLPDGQLADLAGQYGTALESRERARFATGMDRLEKITASKTLVKRNGTVVFLRKKAGNVAPKAGMGIRGSLKESLLDGRVITDRRDITFDFGPALPAIVRDAITLGQVGSVMEVICFGADIYPPEAMPADVYPWSLMQYTITTTGLVSEGGAVARGPVRVPKG